MDKGALSSLQGGRFLKTWVYCYGCSLQDWVSSLRGKTVAVTGCVKIHAILATSSWAPCLGTWFHLTTCHRYTHTHTCKHTHMHTNTTFQEAGERKKGLSGVSEWTHGIPEHLKSSAKLWCVCVCVCLCVRVCACTLVCEV